MKYLPLILLAVAALVIAWGLRRTRDPGSGDIMPAPLESMLGRQLGFTWGYQKPPQQVSYYSDGMY